MSLWWKHYRLNMNTVHSKSNLFYFTEWSLCFNLTYRPLFTEHLLKRCAKVSMWWKWRFASCDQHIIGVCDAIMMKWRYQWTQKMNTKQWSFKATVWQGVMQLMADYSDFPPRKLGDLHQQSQGQQSRIEVANVMTTLELPDKQQFWRILRMSSRNWQCYWRNGEPWSVQQRVTY